MAFDAASFTSAMISGDAVHGRGESVVESGEGVPVAEPQRLTGVDQIYAVLGGFHLNGPLFEPIIDGVTYETVYPMAIREYWRSIFYTSTGGNNCTTTNVLDPVGAGPHQGVIVGMAMGAYAEHVEALLQFLDGDTEPIGLGPETLDPVEGGGHGRAEGTLLPASGPADGATVDDRSLDERQDV